MEPQRYNLVGQAYTARSPAAAAQTCVNLFPERIEDPNEKSKGSGILIGTPGKHLFKDLAVIDASATPFRGALMVNGRLFVAAGTRFFEIDATGALVGSIYTNLTYDAANPTATMFSNGGAQQIMIISANIIHIYDGFSLNTINLPIFTGIVDTDGKVVYWVSGDKFDADMTARSFTLSGRNFTVAVVNSPDVITLTTTAALTITAATTNTTCRLTFSVSHGLLDGAGITISGATGNWLPLNGNWTVQYVNATNVVVTLDTSAFGALTGTPIADYLDTTYQCTIGATRAVAGCVIDGYFVAARYQSTKFNISPLLDGANNGTDIWDQLDFSNIESTPGYFRSTLACNEQLYNFTVTGFEVWQNTGQGVGGFPFERINGATSNVGCISRWCPIDLGGRVGFIGGHEGGIIAYILDGFTPRRVSTFAEEYAWNAASLGVDCISSVYLQEGHVFWEIDFGSQTWVYDLSYGPSIFSGFWHQRYSWSGSAFGAYGRKYKVFAQNSIGYTANDWGAKGKHLCGGDGTGKIYEESVSFYDDLSADMKWQRAVPYRYANGRRIYFTRQTLEYETGTVPSGAEPVVSRDYSDDRGLTFATAQTAGVGTAGQSGKRVYWPTGGSSYNRLWRYSGVGQNKVALVALDSEEEAGAN